jgi:hypothetical protein
MLIRRRLDLPFVRGFAQKDLCSLLISHHRDLLVHDEEGMMSSRRVNNSYSKSQLCRCQVSIASYNRERSESPAV